jgi:hypothetical protein
MPVYYKPFFDVSVSHEWFGEAVPVQVSPCSDTAKTLQRALCRVRSEGPRTSVWYGDANGRMQVTELPEAPLLFRVDARDPALSLATEADWDGG